MTKKKKTDGGKYSKLELAQYRLRKIALDIETSPKLDSKTRAFIIEAFRKIGDGEDANKALGISVKRGERKTRASQLADERKDFILSWLAAVIRPVSDGGLGYSLNEAIDRAATWKTADGKRLKDDTIRNYLDNHPEKRSPTFNPPIRSLPSKRT